MVEGMGMGEGAAWGEIEALMDDALMDPDAKEPGRKWKESSARAAYAKLMPLARSMEGEMGKYLGNMPVVDKVSTVAELLFNAVADVTVAKRLGMLPNLNLNAPGGYGIEIPVRTLLRNGADLERVLQDPEASFVIPADSADLLHLEARKDATLGGSTVKAIDRLVQSSGSVPNALLRLSRLATASQGRNLATPNLAGDKEVEAIMLSDDPRFSFTQRKNALSQRQVGLTFGARMAMGADAGNYDRGREMQQEDIEERVESIGFKEGGKVNATLEAEYKTLSKDIPRERDRRKEIEQDLEYLKAERPKLEVERHRMSTGYLDTAGSTANSMVATAGRGMVIEPVTVADAKNPALQRSAAMLGVNTTRPVAAGGTVPVESPYENDGRADQALMDDLDLDERLGRSADFEDADEGGLQLQVETPQDNKPGKREQNPLTARYTVGAKGIEGPELTAEAFNAPSVKLKTKGLGVGGMSPGEAYLARQQLRRQLAEKGELAADSTPETNWTTQPVADRPAIVRYPQSSVSFPEPRHYRGVSEEQAQRWSQEDMAQRHALKAIVGQVQAAPNQVLNPVAGTSKQSARPRSSSLGPPPAYSAGTAARGPVGLSEESASRARVDHLMERIAGMARSGLTGNGSWRGVDLAAQGEDRPTPYAAPGPAMQALIARRRGY
jgi:hypothetical protein